PEHADPNRLADPYLNVDPDVQCDHRPNRHAHPDANADSNRHQRTDADATADEEALSSSCSQSLPTYSELIPQTPFSREEKGAASKPRRIFTLDVNPIASMWRRPLGEPALQEAALGSGADQLEGAAVALLRGGEAAEAPQQIGFRRPEQVVVVEL